MTGLSFAWRMLVRQPARALLGLLGVAAVGALLFDMLMLSNGLVLSTEQVLASSGFDVRAGRGNGLPITGPAMDSAGALVSRLRGLPEVDDAVAVRYAEGEIPSSAETTIDVRLLGSSASRRRAWRLLEGRDLQGDHEALVNAFLARTEGLIPGRQVVVHGACSARATATPPVSLTIVGVAEFQFDAAGQGTVGASLHAVDRVCGGSGRDLATQLLVASASGSDTERTRRVIERTVPELRTMTNAQLVAEIQRGGLSYFRQISLVLAVVTTGFAFLLVTVLLTVSVNQRIGQLAALRALGFSQRRVVLNVLYEAVLIVGIGAVLAVPLGLALARVLDAILKSIPGIPEQVHFFVFRPQAIVVHVGLFAVTAALAAAYPMRIVARLPIATTLRREVAS